VRLGMAQDKASTARGLAEAMQAKRRAGEEVQPYEVQTLYQVVMGEMRSKGMPEAAREIAASEEAAGADGDSSPAVQGVDGDPYDGRRVETPAQRDDGTLTERADVVIGTYGEGNQGQAESAVQTADQMRREQAPALQDDRDAAVREIAEDESFEVRTEYDPELDAEIPTGYTNLQRLQKAALQMLDTDRKTAEKREDLRQGKITQEKFDAWQEKRQQQLISAVRKANPAAFATETKGVNENGRNDLLDGSRQRNDGESAGEQAGSLDEGAGRAEGRQQTQQGRAASERRNRAESLPKVSARSLGVKKGTERENLAMLPDEWVEQDEELRKTADEVEKKTGRRPRFFVGEMELQAGKKVKYAKGARLADGTILIRADHDIFTAEQIGIHEAFHENKERGLLSVPDLQEKVLGRFTEEEFLNVVDKYIDAYKGVIDIPEDVDSPQHKEAIMRIYEEIFADADAGINAFGANAAMFSDVVQEYVAEQEGKAQTAAATERTTGPPDAMAVDVDMSEEERYEELKDREIVIYEDENENLAKYADTIAEIENLPARAKSKVEKYVKTLAEDLEILNRNMKTPEVEIEFIFSKNKGLGESISKQLRYGGSYADFAKALVNMDRILENAILVEKHGDKYKGTARENRNLDAVYVLFSAFKDKDYVVPVQLEIKKSSDVGGRLYVTVAMTKMEAGVLESAVNKSQAHSLIPTSKYRIANIFREINPADGHFLKYLPEGFLSKEQKKAKYKALREDRARIQNYTKKKLDERVADDALLDAQDLIETVRTVGGIVDENGYITVYHRTNSAAAEKIRNTGRMTAKEDGLFFSTVERGQNEGYGDAVVVLKIPAERLVLDDIFDSEAHLRLPLEGGRRSADVSKYIVEEMDTVTNDSFSMDEDVEAGGLQGEVVPAYDRDMAEQAAKAQGYPVVEGVQIVPNKTYVRCTDGDRNNYGLVTGKAVTNARGEQMLFVMFKNKEEGTKATTKAIAISNVHPVDAMHQPTSAELESLLQSEPEEVVHEEPPVDYYDADEFVPEDLADITLENLTPKAQAYLHKAEQNLMGRLSRDLHLPFGVRKNFLKESVRGISQEIVESGTVSAKTIDDLFERCYEEGKVADDEFYQQHKHVKDYLQKTGITIPENLREDAAAALGFETYEQMRKKFMGKLLLKKEGGMDFEKAYEKLVEMDEDLFGDADTMTEKLQRIRKAAESIRIVEQNLKDYYGKEAKDHKAWAKKNFRVSIQDLSAEIRTARQYSKQKKAQKEKVLPTVEYIKGIWKRIPDAKRAAEKAMAKNLLTDEDMEQVRRLLRGSIAPENLDERKHNVKGITAVYEAKQEYEYLANVIKEYKRHLHAKQDATMDELLPEIFSFKDKKNGLMYARETMVRNIRDIAPDAETAERINRKLFYKVNQNDAKIQRDKADYQKRIEELNLSRKVEKGNEVSEAAAVQIYGEAQEAIAILEDSRGKLKDRDGKTLLDWRAELENLWVKNPNLDKDKIENAVKVFRGVYDDLFQRINEVRIRNGYEPIPYRRGYFPHFGEDGTDGLLNVVGKALGVETDVRELPTTIAGTTHTFKPGIRWFGHAMQRQAGKTAYDAVQGFDKYLAGALDVIHHTEDVQNLRAFARRIRYNAAEENVQRRLDEILRDETLTEDEKQEKIETELKDAKFAMSNFVQELDEYTNLLANKKSKYDRIPESLLGRGIYNLFNWVNRKVGANAVAGNLGSAATNFIPLTQAVPQVGTVNLLSGVADTVKDYSAKLTGKSRDGFWEMSDFLTNRRGISPMAKTGAEKVSDILAKPMEFVDTFTSDSLMRARYRQNISRGMSEAEAMQEADVWAADLMAARNKGAMPTIFAAKSPGYKIFTQFQLEVNNQLSVIMKDMPREMKAQKKSLVLALAQLFFGAWAYNELYEKLVGRRAALDPIDMVNDVVGDLTGYQLPNTLDLFGAAITGKDIKELFETEKTGISGAIKALAKNIAEEIPFVGGLLGGGRVPLNSAIPDLGKLWDAMTNESWSAKKSMQTIAKELAKPAAYLLMPFAGGQIKKTAEGIAAAAKGGSYTVSNEGEKQLQYAMDRNNPLTWLVSGLFGKTATPGGRDWVESGFKSFSAKHTAAYEGAVEAGVPNMEAYAAVDKIRGIQKTEKHSKGYLQREALLGMNLSDDAKRAIYTGTISDEHEERIDAFLDAGRGFDDFLKAQNEGYAERAEEYMEKGVSGKAALDAAKAISGLKKLPGKKQITDGQKLRAIVDSVDSEVQQMNLFGTVLAESTFEKLKASTEYGVTPKTFVSVKERLPEFDKNGNGDYSADEVKKCLNSMLLTKEMRAALWQILTGSKSKKGNPYNKSIGQKIIDAAE